MSWLRRNAESIEAIAASITAHEAYRGHLALATTQPAFAAPADSCTTLNSDQGGAYAAFVDHLVYSAELMLAADPSWDGIFIENLLPHAGYVCTGWADPGGPPELVALLAQFDGAHCAPDIACASGQ
jgi:hypothetical protein